MLRRVRTRRRIAVIKLGTAIVTNAEGAFNRALVRQLAEVMLLAMKAGWQIVVVTSGAVGLGRGLVATEGWKPIGEETVMDRRYLAGLGTRLLIEEWAAAFWPKLVALCLLTNRQFSELESPQLKELLLRYLDSEDIPVLNENDVVSGEALEPDGSDVGFSDNSELAWLVADLLGAEKLIYLSNVEGLLDEKGEIVRDLSIGCHVAEVGSDNSVGRGGMSSTVRYACEAMKVGVEVHIADGRKPEALRQILLTDERPGTYGAPCIR